MAEYTVQKLPTSDFLTTSWARYNVPSYYYQAVDDPVASPNDATDFVYCPGGATADILFGFSATTLPADAINIVVAMKIRAMRDNSGSPSTQATIDGAIRISGTIYNLSAVQPSLSPTFTTYTFSYTTNPATSAAWTNTEVNGIEYVGAKGTGYASGFNTSIPYITQIYLEVTYDLAKPFVFAGPGISTSRKSVSAG